MVRILVGMLCDAGLVSRNLLKVIDEVPRDAVAWSDALRNAELLCARNKKVPDFPPENACPLNTVLSMMRLRGPAGLARIPISSVCDSTERGACALVPRPFQSYFFGKLVGRRRSFSTSNRLRSTPSSICTLLPSIPRRYGGLHLAPDGLRAHSSLG